MQTAKGCWERRKNFRRERERGKNREDFDFENAPRQKEKVERQKELFEVEIITKGKVKSQKAIG